jgi:ribosomal protein L7Ae-like RNA K-turn-binding protein
LYEKPLKIVCVAYQEYELSNGTTRIFGELSENKQKFITLAKTMNIEYMKFSELVKDIDIDSSNCKQSPP